MKQKVLNFGSGYDPRYLAIGDGGPGNYQWRARMSSSWLILRESRMQRSNQLVNCEISPPLIVRQPLQRQFNYKYLQWTSPRYLSSRMQLGNYRSEDRRLEVCLQNFFVQIQQWRQLSFTRASLRYFVSSSNPCHGKEANIFHCSREKVRLSPQTTTEQSWSEAQSQKSSTRFCERGWWWQWRHKFVTISNRRPPQNERSFCRTLSGSFTSKSLLSKASQCSDILWFEISILSSSKVYYSTWSVELCWRLLGWRHYIGRFGTFGCLDIDAGTDHSIGLFCKRFFRAPGTPSWRTAPKHPTPSWEVSEEHDPEILLQTWLLRAQWDKSFVILCMMPKIRYLLWSLRTQQSVSHLSLG